MRFILSFIMLIAGIFMAFPAYAGVVDGPFLVEDLAVMSSDVLVSPDVNEALLMVAPANLPDHLNFSVDNYIKQADLIGATGIKKGGFQNVEIVRLTKFREFLIPGKTESELGVSVANPLLII